MPKRVTREVFEMTVQEFLKENNATLQESLNRLFDRYCETPEPSKKCKFTVICNRDPDNPHEYETFYNNVQQGRTCRKCADREAGLNRRFPISEFRKRIRDYEKHTGYKYIGDFAKDYQRYTTTKNPSNTVHFEFKCDQNTKHKVLKSFHELKEGRGCRECAWENNGKARKVSQKELEKRIKAHEDMFDVEYLGQIDDDFNEYMSTELASDKYRFRFKCKVHNKETLVIIKDLGKRKVCRDCSNDSMASNYRLSEEELLETLSNLHLTLITPYADYKNVAMNIKVRDRYGNILSLNVNKLRSGKIRLYGSSLFENCIYLIISRIFTSNLFMKIRPSWLNYSREQGKKVNSRNNLEIDIFSDELGFGCEVDGEQHDKIDGIYTTTQKQLETLQKRDQFVDEKYHARYGHALPRFKHADFDINELYNGKIDASTFVQKVYLKIKDAAPIHVQQAMNPLEHVVNELENLQDILLGFHPNYFQACKLAKAKGFSVLNVIAEVNDKDYVSYKFKVEHKCGDISCRPLGSLRRYGCAKCSAKNRAKKKVTRVNDLTQTLSPGHHDHTLA